MMSRRAPAFTLIEMMGCILILAILAGLAVVSLRGSNRNAALAGAIEQVLHEDYLAREQARRFDRPVELQFDLAEDLVQIRTVAQQRPVMLAPLHLPAGFRVERLRLGGQWFEQGTTSVGFSAKGQSPSYALKVRAAGQPAQYLVVAGMSGEVQKVQDEAQIDEIFAMVAP